MRIQDALALLGITTTESLTQKDIKTAFRRACQKYHPDKGGSVHMMQAINQAYDQFRDFDPEQSEVNMEDVDFEYPNSLNVAINAIVDFEGIIIEVCGNWVWVTGNTKPYSKELGQSGAGFFWAKKKAAWYFRPAKWKSKSKGTYSLEDIRERHGSQFVKRSNSKKRLGVKGRE